MVCFYSIGIKTYIFLIKIVDSVISEKLGKPVAFIIKIESIVLSSGFNSTFSLI